MEGVVIDVMVVVEESESCELGDGARRLVKNFLIWGLSGPMYRSA